MKLKPVFSEIETHDVRLFCVSFSWLFHRNRILTVELWGKKAFLSPRKQLHILLFLQLLHLKSVHVWGALWAPKYFFPSQAELKRKIAIFSYVVWLVSHLLGSAFKTQKCNGSIMIIFLPAWGENCRNLWLPLSNNNSSIRPPHTVLLNMQQTTKKTTPYPTEKPSSCIYLLWRGNKK